MNPFRMRFSRLELEHIFRAWFVISLAFAVLEAGGLKFSPIFFVFLLASGFTVGLGFLLHELAHKYFAQKYGCHAEFRAFDFMLLLTFVMSFFGFIFAAPGGVFISGNVNSARSGRISAAGPAVNILLAAVFLGVSFLFSGTLSLMSIYGAQINAWLAVFNMLPIAGFDGQKVLRWRLMAFAFLLFISLAMMALVYFVKA